MPFQFTEEQRLLVGTVREVTQTPFKPRAGRYMDGSFPWDNLKQRSEIGVLGMGAF